MSQPPTRMYQCQAAAYKRDKVKQPTTPSTETTPPYHRTLEEAGAAKREVLRNLPQKCSHCSCALANDFFEEVKGSVFVYCKGEGGCGKSQVLFVAPDSTEHPVYSKVCIFAPSPADRDWAPPEPEPEQQGPITATLYVAPEPPSKYNPEAICTSCSIRYAEHSKDPDENGWAITGTETMEYPSDYPQFLGHGKWSHL